MQSLTLAAGMAGTMYCSSLRHGAATRGEGPRHQPGLVEETKRGEGPLHQPGLAVNLKRGAGPLHQPGHATPSILRRLARMHTVTRGAARTRHARSPTTLDESLAWPFVHGVPFLGLALSF